MSISDIKPEGLYAQYLRTQNAGMLNAYRPGGSLNPEIEISTGLKYDAGKPMMSLVDPDAMEGLAKVLTFGASKYDKNNWRNGIVYSRIIDAAERHLAEVKRGNDTDAESGLGHIDHVMCNIMFLSYFMKKRPDLDDRWKP